MIENNYLCNNYIFYFYYLFSIVIEDKIDFSLVKSDEKVASFSTSFKPNKEI